MEKETPKHFDPELPHGLGRLRAPDERDRRHLMSDILQTVAPKPRKRPYELGPTLDQGQTPMCVGFSTRDKIASAPIVVGALKGPSPAVIYAGAQANDEWPGTDYDGTSVRGAFKYLQSLGYLKSYVWASSLADCEQFIRGGYGTIVLGTEWRQGMFYPDHVTGLVKPEGPVVGGHAYHLFWMDPAKREAWCKNSWGRAWGITLNGRQGCFKISYSDLETLLSNDGEAGAGIEVKVK